jgi:hypothetical protein
MLVSIFITLLIFIVREIGECEKLLFTNKYLKVNSSKYYRGKGMVKVIGKNGRIRTV